MTVSLRRLFFVLALLAVPFTAHAADDEDLPRHKPRTTSPVDEESERAAKAKKKRRHSMSIDEDATPPAQEEEAAPPPKKKPKPPADEAPVEETPVESEREEAPREKPSSSAPRPKRTATAEEELSADEMAVKHKEPRLANLDEPGNGFSVEGIGGAMLIDAAEGGVLPRPAGGLHLSWRLGRLFAPENEFLHKALFLDLSWVYTRATVGTTAVNVLSSFHHLALSGMAGLPLGEMLLYGRVGPAMFVSPVHYDIQGAATDFTGVKAGLVYGAGLRGSFYFGDMGLAAGLEVTRYRRQYMDDTLIALSVGMAF